MDTGLIYDVGAHTGEDAEFYLKKGFRVVAIEANPTLVKQLTAKFHLEIEAGRLNVVHAAIAETSGTIDFFVNQKISDWGTTSPTWASRNAALGAPSDRINVRAVTFENVLEQYGVPYYLKVDIEGCDTLCLEALTRFRGRPDFISIESDKVEWQNLLREFDLLKALGYRRFKVIDQSQVFRQEPPHPPREGKSVMHRFVTGSTGLFGNELPGEWLSTEQAIRRYRAIFLSYRLFGDNTPGGRLIWRIPSLRDFLNRWYDTHATL